jgi:hypothetical protein
VFEIIDPLLEKHRGGQLLVDANLLLLCLIGRMNRSRIPGFERTSSYSVDDYKTLEILIAQFKKIVTTPHILTEVSNLAGKLTWPELRKLRELLRQWIGTTLEIFEPSSDVISDPAFKNFGLADAAISLLCKRAGILLLTADVSLYGALTNRGFDAISFKQIQAMSRMR